MLNCLSRQFQRAASKVARQTPLKKAVRADAPTEAASNRDSVKAPNRASSTGGHLPWVVGGVSVYAAGLGASLYFFGSDCKHCEVTRVSEAERRRAYDAGAADYEKQVCSSEDWMGISDLRKTLISKATGRVLEVAAGIGVNLSRNLYPRTCKVTCTDCSAAMVDVASTQLQGRGSGQGGVDAVIESVAVMDADRLAFSDQQFDTVVDTFGLCSFEDPAATLRELQRVCKIGGRILLLEHGRSYFPPVNYLLDWSAHKHAVRWGCYWNRDMLAIVSESGLKVVELQRKHLGTTYMFVLQRER